MTDTIKAPKAPPKGLKHPKGPSKRKKPYNKKSAYWDRIENGTLSYAEFNAGVDIVSAMDKLPKESRQAVLKILVKRYGK